MKIIKSFPKKMEDRTPSPPYHGKCQWSDTFSLDIWPLICCEINTLSTKRFDSTISLCITVLRHIKLFTGFAHGRLDSISCMVYHKKVKGNASG